MEPSPRGFHLTYRLAWLAGRMFLLLMSRPRVPFKTTTGESAQLAQLLPAQLSPKSRNLDVWDMQVFKCDLDVIRIMGDIIFPISE